MAKKLIHELINAGVHFGHGASRWNPKMAPFIFTKRGDTHIIDIKKTLAGMLIARKLIAEVVAGGKDVVFVGTKRQAQKAVETAAQKCGMHFVSTRWLGGTLTNFRTIRSRLQRLEQLEAMDQSGTLESESKKQASRLKREMRKIRANLDGIRKMSRLPGLVVVVDTKKENIALHEAKKLGIRTIGLIDTDADPDRIDVAIPANDDSIRAIELILNELADAVAIGKTMTSAQPEVREKPRRVRSRRPALARADGENAGAADKAEPAPETQPGPAVETQEEPADAPQGQEPPQQEAQAAEAAPAVQEEQGEQTQS